MMMINNDENIIEHYVPCIKGLWSEFSTGKEEQNLGPGQHHSQYIRYI